MSLVMFSSRVLVLFLGATSAAGQRSGKGGQQCAKVANAVAPHNNQWSQKLKMELPNGLVLTGTDLGMDGHISTRTQCSIYDASSGTFGWTYDSGSTTKECGNPPNKNTQCPYHVPGSDPNCHYQFGYHGVSYGITPWGESSSTSKLHLPLDVTEVQHLPIDVDVNYTWTDKSQPPVSSPPFYRSRLIYDFFLTKQEPVAGTSMSSSITDEIIIDLGYNKDFQMACGYHGQSPAPKIANFIPGFDLMDIQEGDSPDGQHFNVRMTHFRRQGGECSGKGACEVNGNLDLMPFITKAREYSQATRVQASGKYLGVVELGTEIYDNIHAEVSFKKFAVGPPSLAKTSHVPEAGAEILV